MYESTTIITVCLYNRKTLTILKTVIGGSNYQDRSNGAYRLSLAFDLDGRVTSDRWRPGSKLLEIRRTVYYIQMKI
jgi:hypothetical protein